MGASAALSTPVALVVFNRPDPTARVFERVRAARPSTLLLVADGPRADRAGEADRCAAVRELVTRVDWDCDVRTEFADVNLGCKRRVSSGIDWVFRQVPEAIILEDDCVPHPTFFPFCERMLARYRDDERVSMVGGTNYAPQLPREASYLFSRHYAIWGWATWRRAWSRYDLAMADWPALRAAGTVRYWYPQAYMQRYVTAMFDVAHADAIDTWDIQWFYSCLVNSTLSIVPRANQIANIGYVGTHTDAADQANPAFNMATADVDVDRLQHPRLVLADSEYDFTLFEQRIRRSARHRLGDGARTLAMRARRGLLGRMGLPATRAAPGRA